jgi:hypothetical protein
MQLHTSPDMLTFPARPVNGGRLELARPKRGTWFYEPKVNGWRALAHVPSRTAWNRHGQPLSIASAFNGALAMLDAAGVEWADVEAIERRHALMRGSLFLLDLPTHPGDYVARRNEMERRIEIFSQANVHATDDVFILPTVEAAHASTLYANLVASNAALGAEFYEGLVAKKAGSLYPIQLRSATQEFPEWAKHRWS